MVYQPKSPVGYRTPTYVQFLGFSRGSLEELKGDFEELKREWKEGLRWADRGSIRERRSQEIREKCSQEIREKTAEEMKGRIMKEIEGLLDLIYGEDCMMGRQIASLEKKMIEEKTLPRSEIVKMGWGKSASGDRRFWGAVEERFGLRREDRGIVRRVDKGAVSRDGKGGVSRDDEGAVSGDEKGEE